PQRTAEAVRQSVSGDTASRRLATVAAVERGLGKRRLPRRRGAARHRHATPGRRRSPWLVVGTPVLVGGALLLVWSLLLGPRSVAADPASRSRIALHTGGLVIERDGHRLSAAGLTELRPGDRLRTGPEARAVLAADARAHCLLGAQSELLIEAVAPARRWRLTRGELTAGLDPAGTGDQGLTVSTPHARVAVVGTLFRLAAEPDASELEVIAGAVDLTAAGVPDQRITAGLVATCTPSGTRGRAAIPGDERTDCAFLPGPKAVYASGRFVLDADLDDLRDLWPIDAGEVGTPRPGGVELDNPDVAQRDYPIPFGGCALPSFALAFSARMSGLGPEPELAIVDQKVFTPQARPELAPFTGSLPAGPATDGAWSASRNYVIAYRHVGYLTGAGKPIYEMLLRVDGVRVGQGLVLGAPRQLVLGLRAGRVQIAGLRLCAFTDGSITDGKDDR
ncbi:MAG: FecR domain-containing protein, partial [Planctomycetota bacterium]